MPLGAPGLRAEFRRYSWSFWPARRFFLRCIAWRRCTHADRSRLLFGLALLVELPALAILLYDYLQFRSEPAGEHATHSHPLIIPLVQWIVVLAVWIVLAIREGREKRAKQATEKTA